MILARCCWQLQLSAQMLCLVSLITAWNPRCKRHRGCGRVCAGKGDTISHALPLSSLQTLRSLSFFFLSLCISLLLSSSQVSTFIILCTFVLARSRGVRLLLPLFNKCIPLIATI